MQTDRIPENWKRQKEKMGWKNQEIRKCPKIQEMIWKRLMI